MPDLKSRKTSGTENNGFTETLEYKVLHQSNVSTNHNKFYALEIQKSPQGTYRLFCHYGRLGVSNVYEVRDNLEGNPITDYNLIKKEFDRIIKKKITGKTVVNEDTGKKEKESYVEVSVASPDVGSENIRGKKELKVPVNIKIAINTPAYKKQVADLLDQLIEENVHNITSMTSLTYTDGGFRTPVGSVTPDHVKKSREPLKALNNLLDNNGKVDPLRKEVRDLNNLYYSLIPHAFGRRLTVDDMIVDSLKLQQEFDLLDQLETAVQMGDALSGTSQAKLDTLGSEIEELVDAKEVNRVFKYIRDSKASNHRGSDIWNYEPRKVFKIRIPEERTRYEALGLPKKPIKELFHGSSSSNILSILKSGLVVPPVNAPHVCGRMFGNGAYFASSSTKSLNYSLGFWGGRRSKYGNLFMFLADFAQGRYYETGSALSSGTPKGYDTIWAKAGRGLYNDEFISPVLENQSLKYLVEFTK
jgi:poly [ADP-ribose] polymerase